jgi:hypothetical protein
VSSRRGAALAAAAVALLVLGAAAVVLSRSATRLAAADGAKVLGYAVVLKGGQTACQTGEAIPADTRTLALGVGPLEPPGPPLQVRVGRASVAVHAGYRDGELRIALAPGARGGGPVCIRNAGRGGVGLAGQTAAAAIPPGIGFSVDGKPQPAAVQLRWLTAPRSGWNAIGPALRRWGYASALGAATPYVAILLFALAFGGAAALAVRGRAGATACAAIAFAAAAGWALTTPAFHVPDEPQHFAYLQRLAESGHVPTPVPGPVFSPEEGAAFASVQFNQVVGNPAAGRPPWTAEREAQLRAALAGPPSRFTPGGDTNTTNNPPLYYVAELGPYWAATAAGGGFFDRLLAVRLGSALLAALAVAFAYRFVREVLPATPWAAPVGALAFAVQPLLGFVGGGVNNDAGLFAAGAAVFWLVARALRRGLDTRGAIGIGLAMGLGLITKATIAGLAPGLLLAAALVLARAPDRRATLRRIGIAAAITAVPIVAYVLANRLVWDRALWSGGGVTATATPTGRAAQLTEFASYLWQFYLPRLPFMQDLQAGIPLYNVWFKGFIGRFGWLDTAFGESVYSGAAAVFAAILALAAAGLWRARRTLGRHGWELAVYAGMVAGFLLVVGWAGYRGRLDTGQIFEQARYLLPLGALYAALIALAARGAGRAGRAAGAALVTLACGHALFAIGLVVSRFYV